ncbi:MAG: ABC transporter ATP-binding protein [Parvibaculaceae bacterium]
MPSAHLLELRDVSVGYPVSAPSDAVFSRRRRLTAVSDVSFAMSEGETYALIGESGSGKSSLAMAIAGLQPVDGGRILVAGEDVTIKPPGHGARRKLAVLFQDAAGSLSPRLSVGTTIAEALRHAGFPKASIEAEVARLLGLVGLPPHLAVSYPHQLSGGQARRVAVARALALDPRLIVADEPTAGLDASVQGEIVNLLMRLQRELGIGILVISHNLHIVRLMSARIGVIYLGRLVEEGPTEDVLGNPAHPYTAGLAAANLSSDPAVPWPKAYISGEVPSVFDRPSGCVLNPRCPRADAQCRSVVPARREITPGRFAACFWPLLGAPAPTTGGA